MEPVAAISTAAWAVLAPIVEKGAKAAGEAALEKAQELLDFLKEKFRGDQQAEDIVDRFEEEPDLYEVPFRKILERHLQSDEGLAAELRELLESQGSKIEIDIVAGDADTVTGAEIGEATSLEASAKIKVDKAKEVVGFKIDKID